MPESLARPRIAVNRDLCIGSGVCIAYAPNTLSHDEETRVVVTDLEGDSVRDVRAAVEGCPTAALRLIEQEGD